MLDDEGTLRFHQGSEEKAGTAEAMPAQPKQPNAPPLRQLGLAGGQEQAPTCQTTVLRRGSCRECSKKECVPESGPDRGGAVGGWGKVKDNP
jgi:hypothetical protein